MLHERVSVMQRMLCGNHTLCFLCIRKFDQSLRKYENIMGGFKMQNNEFWRHY